MKFNNIFLFKLTVCFMPLLQSMDNLILAENKVIVWDVILAHDKSLFNHNMIRSLAVNKEFETRLRTTAKDRRQYCVSLASSIIYKDILEESGRWHKYGSACGTVGYVDDPTTKGKYWLHLERLDLVNGGKTQYRCHTIINFGVTSYRLSFALSNDRKRFFDEDDEFCCYGYSNKDSNDRVCKDTIVLYKLSPQGFSQEIIVCGTDINKKEVAVSGQLDSRNVFFTFFDGITEFFTSV